MVTLTEGGAWALDWANSRWPTSATKTSHAQAPTWLQVSLLTWAEGKTLANPTRKPLHSLEGHALAKHPSSTLREVGR